MTKVLALVARARPRTLISVLMISTTSVVALEVGPLTQALSALWTAGGPMMAKTVKRPAVDPDAVQPFYLHAANPAERERAVHCMTDALYYEAAHEPVEGQRAVAQVVVNRVRDPHFPKSVCGVVYEGWERSTGCQFSFACDGSIRRRHADPALWSSLRPIAEQALSGYVTKEVGTATHYYAEYVRPNWTRTVARVAEIGKHIFCSWKGKAGRPSALAAAYQGGELDIAQAALDGVRAEVKHTVESVRHAGRRKSFSVTHRIELAEHRGHGRVYSRLNA